MTIDLNTIDFDGITTAQGLYSAYEKVFTGFPIDDAPTMEQLTAVETALADPRWDTTSNRLDAAGIEPTALTAEQQNNLGNWMSAYQIDELFLGAGSIDGGLDTAD